MFPPNDRPLSPAALGDRLCFLGGRPLISRGVDNPIQPGMWRYGAVLDVLRCRAHRSPPPGASDDGSGRGEGMGAAGGGPLSPGGVEVRVRDRRPRWLCGAVTLAWLIGSVVAAFRSAPDDVPASVAEGDFDIGRAIAHLRTIAAESHFIGTAAHDRVRDYILTEASRIPGVHAELQTVEASYRTWDPIAVATVSNVVARLRQRGAGNGAGSGAGRAVLVVAHYDSTPTGPGAADDGSAVASMLEVLRLAASGPAPRNELVFLFTDAEEVGSMGAAGFVAQLSAEERARIATVLNFDARGNRGPVVMFETSRDNGWLVQQWAAAAPHPVGSSLVSAAYGLVPNDTDFSVFRDAGLPGLNFAYFDGLEVYHTGRETLEALDLRSVQHQGAQMLGLVRHLASADLEHAEAAPVVYFDVLGRFVVQYGAWLSWLLAAACALGMAWIVARGVRTRRLRSMRCAAATGITVATIVAAALLARATWAAVTWLEPRYTQIPGELPWSPGYFAGLLLLAAAVVLRGSRLFARRIDPAEAAVGALVPWIALAAVTPFALPGASYFFQWPALCGLGLVGAMLRDRERRRWLLPASLLVVVPTLLVVPFVRMLFAAFGMTGIALVVGLWALWLALLAPYLRAALGAAQPWLARAAAVAGAAALVVAFAGRTFDRAHPTCDSLAYLVDADHDRAFWVSADARLDDWTEPTLGAGAHLQSIEHDFPDVFWDGYVAPAPRLEGAAPEAPELIVRSDTRQGAIRHLALGLVPRAAGSMLELQVTANVLAVDVAGTHREAAALGGDRGRVLLQFWTPAAGVDLALTVPAEAPDAAHGVTLRLAEVQYASAAVQRLVPRARSADHIPNPFGWFSDSIRVVHTVRL